MHVSSSVLPQCKSVRVGLIDESKLSVLMGAGTVVCLICLRTGPVLDGRPARDVPLTQWQLGQDLAQPLTERRWGNGWMDVLLFFKQNSPNNQINIWNDWAGKVTFLLSLVRRHSSQHCNNSNNINRYGKWRINSELNWIKSCPTYRSIDGLQKAITNSFQWVTIPSPTFSGLGNQWHSYGHREKDIRVLQQTALEQLLLGAQKCITLSMMSFLDPRCHTGVCGVSICSQVLPVVKHEHRW